MLIDYLVCVCTYFSDSCLTASWLDHVVYRSDIDSKLSDIALLYGYIGSDHRPLSVTISDVVLYTAGNEWKYGGADYVVPDWSNIDNRVLVSLH